MKILSNQQVRRGDQYTIENEPISSFGLMKRASNACSEWILNNYPKNTSFIIFCGPGNNGGDGFCIAHFLKKLEYHVQVVDLSNEVKTSDDQKKAKRLYGAPEYNRLQSIESIPSNTVIIDALFGSGLSRPLTGKFAKAVEWINNSGVQIISIDCPSGLDGDAQIQSLGVKANHTLVFEQPKLSFLIHGLDKRVGHFHIIKIGISSQYTTSQQSIFSYLTDEEASQIIQPVDYFGYKGSKGHVAIIGGSRDTFGAPTLSARAAFRSGCGLVSVFAPSIEFKRHVDNFPEIMYSTKRKDENSVFPDFEKKLTYGIGPGLGLNEKVGAEFYDFIALADAPIVVDADGLNLLANYPKALSTLPKNSILTPHLGELKRLLNINVSDGLLAYQAISNWCVKNQIIIILKSTYTCVFCPTGQWIFNSSGTPALSTAGSGDVLTGIVSSLLAQGYSPIESASLAVWIHGKAGQKASELIGERSVMASDIIEAIPSIY